MKVSYLVPTAHDVGGTAGAIVTQANAMARHHEVEIISVYRTSEESHFAAAQQVVVRDLVPLPDSGTRSAGPESPHHTPAQSEQPPSLLIPNSWDPHYDRRADVALDDALSRLSTDVLVTVTPGLLAAAVQLAPRSTVIVHQEHRSSSQRTAGMEPLLAFAPRADTVVLLTTSMADWLLQQLGRSAPQVEVVPNGLSPGYRPQSRLDNPLIAAAGRLVAEKQYGHLISAFARIGGRLPGWRLRIFGDGPQRWDLMRRIREEGLFDRVELPGTMTDPPSEWAKASISALSSVSEGFPLVIQEAMAAGVPVVSYDCPSGPREIIDHGVNGLLVGQNSVTGMSAALLDLATDPHLRATLGKAALAKAGSYDAGLIAERWLEIFEAAIGHRRGEGGRRTTRLQTAASGATPRSTNPDQAPVGAEGALVTPSEARRTILELLVGVASAVTDMWFAIPPHAGEAPIVVVPMEERRRFLDRLAVSDPPAFISFRDPDGRGWPERRGKVGDMVRYLRRGMTASMAVEPWPLVAGAPSLLGQGCTTWVQFWEKSVDGHLHSPVPNRYARQVSPGAATVNSTVDGVELPTLPIMAGPSVADCRFPIDVVYTWVDGADPVWNEARERRLAGVTDRTMLGRASSGRARFETRDELRYSMRGVHLFAPWVRTIHLVTAGQVPAWLHSDDSRVRVVDHRQILAGDVLPTFNSHAIETALHRIPDLAEHFLYLNDDVFFGRPVGPEMFFNPGGDFAVFPSINVIGLPAPDDPPYLAAAANNRRLLLEAFGVTATNTMAHTPHPHVRSVLEEMVGRFQEDIEETAATPFRSNRNVSLLSSFAQNYGLITGSAFVGSIEQAFVNLSEHNVERQLRDLLKRDRDCFCVADHHDYALPPARVGAFVSKFFATYFPIPAPWELPPG